MERMIERFKQREEIRPSRYFRFDMHRYDLHIFTDIGEEAATTVAYLASETNVKNEVALMRS